MGTSRLGRTATGVIAAGLALAAWVATVPGGDGRAVVLAQPVVPSVGWVDGRTDVWVQNLDVNMPATVRADYYPVAGIPPLTAIERTLESMLRLGPGRSTVFRYSSPSPESDTGAAGGAVGRTFGQLGQYAVIVNSTRRVATLNYTVEPFTGAAVTYTNVDVAPEIIVPLMTRGFSRPGDMTSIVSIQSTETNPMTTVNATVFSKTYFQDPGPGPNTGAYDPAKVNPPVSRTLSAVNTGGSWMTDLSQWNEFDALEAAPPGRTLVGTVGWMKITTPGADVRVGAETFANLRAVNTAVSGYAAVPIGKQTKLYYLPLFRGLFDGITGVSIVNPNTSPVRVRLTYLGSELPGHACVSQSGVHAGPNGIGTTIPIAANDNEILYQLPAGAIAPSNVGQYPLAGNCFGSALLEVTEGEGVVAMMHDVRIERMGGIAIVRTASGYMPVRQEDTARRVALPLVRHDSTKLPGARVPRVATGIQVMNASRGGAPANVTIRFFDLDGNPIPQASGQRTIPLHRAHTWWTGAVPGFNDRAPGVFEASAIIESDTEVAVIATIATVDADSVTYNGFGAE